MADARTAGGSALGGYKVLELSEGVAGEYCGKLLADFGAQVIKLERPGQGSPTRRLSPRAGANAGRPEHECSALFAYLNTGKRSVSLDVARAAADGTLARLLDAVDVVIDDHDASWLATLGLSPEAFEQRWPRAVLCSITPYGHGAPADRRHAADLNVFHASGWGYHTPSGADADAAPLKGPGPHLASYEAGLDAALCIAASLYEREASQLGRVIDISQQQVLASRVDYVLGQMVAGDMEPSTDRRAFDLFGPAGIFRCRDGYVYIWMSAPSHWDGLRELLGAPAWMDGFPPRWLERECTAERVAQVRARLGEWLAGQDREATAGRAQKLGLTMVAVNDADDLKASPQFLFRKYFAPVEHPVLGRLSHPTVPYRLSATPASIRSAAPLLGEAGNADAALDATASVRASA